MSNQSKNNEHLLTINVTQPGCGPGCVTRRSLAMLEDRSSIPGAGNNNVLVTRLDWPTLVSSVCYTS